MHEFTQQTPRGSSKHAVREFECDYGFVGEDGACVPWTDPNGPDPPTEAPSPGPANCGALGQMCCIGDDVEQCIGADLECSSSPFFPETECVACGGEGALCCFDPAGGADGQGKFSCNDESLVCDNSLQDVGRSCVKGAGCTGDACVAKRVAGRY